MAEPYNPIKVFQADLTEPYVLLNGADQAIARDYEEYRSKHREKLELYLSAFVVPRAPQEQ